MNKWDSTAVMTAIRWKQPETCEGCTWSEEHFGVHGCALLRRAVAKSEPECAATDWSAKQAPAPEKRGEHCAGEPEPA